MKTFNIGDEVVVGGSGNTSTVKFGKILKITPVKQGVTNYKRYLLKVVTVNFNSGNPVFSTGSITEPEYKIQHMNHGMFEKLGL